MSINRSVNGSVAREVVLPITLWVAACLMLAMLMTSYAAITDARACHDRGGHIVLSGPLNTTSTCTYRP